MAMPSGYPLPGRARRGGVVTPTLATSKTDVLDALLDQLQERREYAFVAAPSAHRAARLAELYEREARVWSLLFEHSRSRIYWRAALSAEAYARAHARSWRTQAAALRSRFGRPAPLGGRREGWLP